MTPQVAHSPVEGGSSRWQKLVEIVKMQPNAVRDMRTPESVPLEETCGQALGRSGFEQHLTIHWDFGRWNKVRARPNSTCWGRRAVKLVTFRHAFFFYLLPF